MPLDSEVILRLLWVTEKRGRCNMGIAGFKQQFVTLGQVKISVHVGGNGPPLLLLHGFPQIT